MFLDLAFVEGESFWQAGFRAGAKMRAKKMAVWPVQAAEKNLTADTSAIVAYQAGIGRCAGDSLKPPLLGLGNAPVWKYEDGKGVHSPVVWWPHFASTVIEMQTSTYNMSNTVVMLRARTQTQKLSDLYYSLQNRLWEANHSDRMQVTTNSSIVHNYFSTASYGLGSIYFNPAKNTTFGAIAPQESMID